MGLNSLVSIVIPCYQQQDLLFRALNPRNVKMQRQC